MQRAGIMHIVAISGMHVAFIVGFVRQFTGKRRKTALICIPLILVFIPMTGGSASVIRAGFMQICLLLAPLLRRENDSITSLSAVLALLLLANPYAVAGAGLQLSFAAMAGILLVTPRVYDGLTCAVKDTRLAKGKLLPKLTRFLVTGFSSTIGAMVFTTPLLALHFGFVPLYSVVTNLLTLSLMSLCFTLGYGMCVLGLLWPVLGMSAGWVLAWPLRLVILIVKWIADWPYAALYTSGNMAAWWLIFVYVLFVTTYALKGKSPYRPILPVGISVCTLCLVLFLTGLNADRESGPAVLDVGQGQSVAVFSGRDTVLVDCGGMATLENAGETAAEYLLSSGRTKVDLLVLTHFHKDHAGGAARLMAYMDVKRLAIPRDVEDEDGLLPEILDTAARHGVEVLYIDEDSTVEFGSLSLRIFAPIGADSMNERGLVVLASIGDFDVLVTGDASSVIERRLLYRETLPDIEVLVAGHHGSRYSTCAELLERTRPDAAVISVGYNTYGHPAEETLERLADAGVKVYRTDWDGTVSIKSN